MRQFKAWGRGLKDNYACLESVLLLAGIVDVIHRVLVDWVVLADNNQERQPSLGLSSFIGQKNPIHWYGVNRVRNSPSITTLTVLQLLGISVVVCAIIEHTYILLENVFPMLSWTTPIPVQNSPQNNVWH